MKAWPPAPNLDRLWALPSERARAVLQRIPSLDDSDFLHWERLRHKSPPSGLTVEEWWLALKFKRSTNPIVVPALQARNGNPLHFNRPARIEAALSRLDQSLAGKIAVPHRAAIDRGGRDQFVVSSLMEEAIHSSLFEGAVHTREDAKDMLRRARPPINHDERMILNNYRAMERIRELRDTPLSVDLLLELHRIITDGTLKDPNDAGRFQSPRDARVQVFDQRLHRIVHDPPPADQLPQRMERLIAFANADHIDGEHFIHPIVRSILLHFQLAYDHPFADGNGRTARALFYWSMLRRGYWLTEYLSISRLLYRNRGPYERAYIEVESDGQDATYFLLQQLSVLEQAQCEMFAYIEHKSQAQANVRATLRGRDDLNHRQLALIDHALRNPDARFTYDSHANSHRVTVMTARRDIVALVELGILLQQRLGKGYVFVPRPLLERFLANLDVPSAQA